MSEKVSEKVMSGKATPERVYNVLFLCTGNSARSILAEAILRKDGRGNFRAFSAGSQPKGAVNPFALRVLQKLEYPTDDLRSKGWGEFARAGRAGDGFRFHGLRQRRRPSPARFGRVSRCRRIGASKTPPRSMARTSRRRKRPLSPPSALCQNRIGAFTSLPLRSIDRLSLGAKLREIGRSAGATSSRPDVA